MEQSCDSHKAPSSSKVKRSGTQVNRSRLPAPPPPPPTQKTDSKPKQQLDGCNIDLIANDSTPAVPGAHSQKKSKSGELLNQVESKVNESSSTFYLNDLEDTPLSRSSSVSSSSKSTFYVDDLPTTPIADNLDVQADVPTDQTPATSSSSINTVPTAKKGPPSPSQPRVARPAPPVPTKKPTIKANVSGSALPPTAPKPGVPPPLPNKPPVGVRSIVQLTQEKEYSKTGIPVPPIRRRKPPKSVIASESSHLAADVTHPDKDSPHATLDQSGVSEDECETLPVEGVTEDSSCDARDVDAPDVCTLNHTSDFNTDTVQLSHSGTSGLDAHDNKSEQQKENAIEGHFASLDTNHNVSTEDAFSADEGRISDITSTDGDNEDSDDSRLDPQSRSTKESRKRPKLLKLDSKTSRDTIYPPSPGKESRECISKLEESVGAETTKRKSTTMPVLRSDKSARYNRQGSGSCLSFTTDDAEFQVKKSNQTSPSISPNGTSERGRDLRREKEGHVPRENMGSRRRSKSVGAMDVRTRPLQLPPKPKVASKPKPRVPRKPAFISSASSGLDTDTTRTPDTSPDLSRRKIGVKGSDSPGSQDLTSSSKILRKKFIEKEAVPFKHLKLSPLAKPTVPNRVRRLDTKENEKPRTNPFGVKLKPISIVIAPPKSPSSAGPNKGEFRHLKDTHDTPPKIRPVRPAPPRPPPPTTTKPNEHSFSKEQSDPTSPSVVPENSSASCPQYPHPSNAVTIESPSVDSVISENSPIKSPPKESNVHANTNDSGEGETYDRPVTVDADNIPEDGIYSAIVEVDEDIYAEVDVDVPEQTSTLHEHDSPQPPPLPPPNTRLNVPEIPQESSELGATAASGSVSTLTEDEIKLQRKISRKASRRLSWKRSRKQSMKKRRIMVDNPDGIYSVIGEDIAEDDDADFEDFSGSDDSWSEDSFTDDDSDVEYEEGIKNQIRCQTSLYGTTPYERPETIFKPSSECHQVAHEMLTTEKAYVGRLELIDQVFQFKVIVQNRLDKMFADDEVPKMFSNIKSIYQFHSSFLLPQLQTLLENWEEKSNLGDVMRKFAPFLKIYSDYVKNYDTAIQTISHWCDKSPAFSALVTDIQKRPECGSIRLVDHMLDPIQRIPRYELLLKTYLKHLPEDSDDRESTEKALELVITAASHSNEAMRKIDKFRKLLDISECLIGDVDLILPGRELITEGKIIKISGRRGEHNERYLFLFNDMLLVCQTVSLVGLKHQYKIKAKLDVEGMKVTESENLVIRDTFYIKSKQKSIELLASTSDEKIEWQRTLWGTIRDYTKKQLTRFGNAAALDKFNDEELGERAPTWIKDKDTSMCMQCSVNFTTFRRRHHCRACGIVVCGGCSSHKARLPYDNDKENRVCDKCFLILEGKSGDLAVPSHIKEKRQVLQVKASDAAVLNGYLNMWSQDKKTWTRRWISAHSDFVLYFFKAHQDVVADSTLPLPGLKVQEAEPGDRVDRTKVFKLTHAGQKYFFQPDDKSQFQRWIDILEKLTKAEDPTCSFSKSVNTEEVSDVSVSGNEESAS